MKTGFRCSTPTKLVQSHEGFLEAEGRSSPPPKPANGRASVAETWLRGAHPPAHPAKARSPEPGPERQKQAARAWQNFPAQARPCTPEPNQPPSLPCPLTWPLSADYDRRTALMGHFRRIPTSQDPLVHGLPNADDSLVRQPTRPPCAQRHALRARQHPQTCRGPGDCAQPAAEARLASQPLEPSPAATHPPDARPEPLCLRTDALASTLSPQDVAAWPRAMLQRG